MLSVRTVPLFNLHSPAVLQKALPPERAATCLQHHGEGRPAGRLRRARPSRDLNLASIRRVVADSDRAAVENGR